MNKHYDQATFPSFMLPKIQATGVNGLLIKGYGSPGVSYLECGAINFEMGKVDASFSTGFAIHNAAAFSIYEYGDEEQKQRLLPVYLAFKKMIGFALTEPNFGSYATGLQTTARKVEGGYVLNGEKYWIGNGMTGDCLVWARNEDDGGRI